MSDDPRREEDDVPDLVRRMRVYKERHLRRPRPVRWLFVAVGFTVLLSGLAMLILPGPALAVIPIGLFLLALEFQWAETWLERSIHQADRAKQRAAETSTTMKVITAGGTVLAIAGFAAWAIVGDVPLLPV